MFYIGQKVVCVEDLGHDSCDPKKGLVYTIESIDNDCGCEAGLILVEITYRIIDAVCSFCLKKSIDNRQSYTTSSFRPIDTISESMQFSTKVVKELEVEINRETLIEI